MAGGSVDYFLKIDGIPGEATDDKHKDEIDILSWNWGASQTGTMSGQGGGGAGKVRMQDFNFVMVNNLASPKLMLACATGQHIPKAVLTCRKAGGEQQENFIVTFTDMLVSGYSVAGTSEVPTDSISMNFSKIEFAYAPQSKDGTLGAVSKAGYDLKLMKKV